LGRLIREGEVWRLTGLDAQIGDSDLSGRLSATLSGPRPFISADLRSRRLLAEDLMPGPEAGQGAEAAAEETAKGRHDPITPSGVNFDALPEVDASVHFHGDYVKVPEVVFQQLELDLELRDRVAVVDATGDGTFRQFKPVAFEVHAGTEDSLENPEARYPLDLVLQAGDTVARAEGTVDRPLNYTALDLDVALRGPDLQMLGAALQLPLPATPPYRLTGKLTHQDEHERWNLVAVRGTVGGSDLTGDVSLELDAARPTIVAKLQSNTLDFDDFVVAVGAPPDTQPGETASPRQAHQAAQGTANGRVLPDKKFRVPELRAFDARVSFTGESIQARMLPLEGLTLELTLDDGLITVRPLRVDLAGGELQAAAQLDGREDVPAGRFEVALRQISINELLSRFEVDVAEIENAGVGTLSGRATLEVRGNSIRDLAAGADGQLLLIMNGGRINELILEAVGLDIGGAIVLLLNGQDEDRESEMVPVQCFVGRFETREGLMQTEALVLETSDSTITGKGEADLGKETLALELLAHPKDASALTASTPVRIEGTFRAPKTGLVSEELQEKSLAALALGVVLPVIGAVLPFVEQGETEGINCQRLIQDAQAAMPDAPAMDESR
jgi:AsmA family protein